MPFHRIPPHEVVDRLFALVGAESPGLLPACRWLLLGPRLAALVLPETRPSAAELTSLLRLLRDRDRSLLPLGRELVQLSEHGEAALLELCVDRLLEHSNWEHPTQVLEQPRPDFGKLLKICQARLRRSRGDNRGQVAAVTAKVERAARIADSARERRRRMREGRRRQ